MAWLGQQVIRDLRNKVYDKVMHWEMRQFDKTPIGTLTTRTINDIERINDIFSDGLIPILADFLTIIITLTTMFFINWQLTLICLIPFPIMLMQGIFSPLQGFWNFLAYIRPRFVIVSDQHDDKNIFQRLFITIFKKPEAISRAPI